MAPTASAGGRLRAWTSPKHLVTLLITFILVVGEWAYGVVGGYEKLALTLGTCLAVEALLSYFVLGRRPMLSSAYITGVSLTILLRPQAGLVWPFVVGAALSVGSKYVLRYRGRHLWNPSNFGIAALLLLAPARVAILSHEFGNEIWGNLVIWFVGLLVASRARVLHITLTYVGSFAALAALRAWIVGGPLLAELAPLTGPMYQLMAFFMMTDPATTVGTVRGRMATVGVIALLEAVLRLANDLELPGAGIFAPAPPILALAVVGPIALALDLKRRAAPAAAPAPAPAAAVPLGR